LHVLHTKGEYLYGGKEVKMDKCLYGYTVPTEFFLRGAKECPFLPKDGGTQPASAQHVMPCRSCIKLYACINAGDDIKACREYELFEARA
jgi:hypothetical protein